MDLQKVNRFLSEAVGGLAEGSVTGRATGTTKVGSEKFARKLAREKGLAYGHSVFGGGWYVGPAKELKKIGVMIKEDVELAEGYGGYHSGNMADELRVFIDNDGDLYRGMTTSIYKNLVNKKAAGRYNSTLALKAFLNLATEGAQRYVKQVRSHSSVGEQPWHKKFPMSVRKEAAKDLLYAFEQEMKLGNYDHMLFKKYQKKGK